MHKTDLVSSAAADDAELTIVYQARPYVCGAIGTWDARILRRLLSASPGELQEICSSPLGALWSTKRLDKRTSGARPGYLWGALATGSAPADWREAAQHRLAAGLQLTEGAAVLHTDGLGMQDLYYRQVRDAIYFSVRIEPLLEIGDARLSTDWDAWASIIALTCPLGDSTPFRQVRRMTAATAWRVDQGARPELETFEPDWLKVEPSDKVTPAEALDALAGHTRSQGRRILVTLSGGWDSRLLAVLAARSRRRLLAWTTSNDDGFDFDVKLARPVADALRAKHHMVLPGPEAWAEEHELVHRRLSYQTPHHVWIMPLARTLHGRSDELLDGLAGDVLFKRDYLFPERGSGVLTPQLHLLWSWLEGRRLQQRNLLAPKVAEALEERSRESFTAAVARYRDHPAAPTLAVLHTRTARAIAGSPLWLLGPELRVRLPFIHPEVLTTALRVPSTAKVGGGFYEQMLRIASPTVASFPSTNSIEKWGRQGPLRQASSRALRTMAESILSDEAVLHLLGPEIRLALNDPQALSLVGRSLRGLRLLQGLSMFAEWRRAHKSRLSDDHLDVG